MSHIIIAPHADDEIIGCWEILNTGLIDIVYFPTEKARQECKGSALAFGFEHRYIDPNNYSVNWFQGNTLFVPDPNYDFHPEHRLWGQFGERLLRKHYCNVIFYNTNMNAPYIREVKKPHLKRQNLDSFYPEKADLWEYDHRYFLFEGQTQWRMQWGD